MSEKAEKRPMQTKNKILIAAASIIVIAGIAVGIYFGVRKNDNANGSSSNSSSGNAIPPSSATTSAAPQPTGVLPPAGQNGTMVNGTLFPYYTLTGPVPAPKTTAGTVYTNCVEPGTYSISYDDGPSAVSCPPQLCFTRLSNGYLPGFNYNFLH